MIKMILLISSLLFAGTCPRWDNAKSYDINECVYYDASGTGRNYWSEHKDNAGNPPAASVWFWDECSSKDVNCINQFTDSTITYTDTVIVYDTIINVFNDTNIFNDTIQFTDTTLFIDTNIITVNDTNTFNDTIQFIDTTLFIDSLKYIDSVLFIDTNVIIINDTNIINDTVLVRDTVGIDTLVIDTLTKLFNMYDTTFRDTTVIDTTTDVLILYDTTRIPVSVDSLFAVSKTIKFIDTVYITGYDEVKHTIVQNDLRDIPHLVIELDFKDLEGVKPYEDIKLNVSIVVYDHTGQYTDKIDYNEEFKYSERLNQVLSFALMDRDGDYARTVTGRLYSTGVYLMHIQIELIVDDQVIEHIGTLSKTGYRRSN